MGSFTSISIHEALKGKIGITLTFKDVGKLKKYFTFKNLKRLLEEK